MKTVWITKSIPPDLDVIPAGWRTIHAPILEAVPAATPPEPPRPHDVLVFTSGNGVKFFCAYTDRRHWSVYTVGDATAKMARSAGFKTVKSAGKDVTALYDLINSDEQLKSKRLYYASGQEIIGDLVQYLRDKDYFVIRQVLYETRPVLDISSELKAEINKNASLCVFLYSPKGARVFRSLDIDFSTLDVISISRNVDKHLSGIRLKSRKIAEKPTHISMIKHLR